MDPTQLRLEALKLAVQYAAWANSYTATAVTQDAKVFEDYLLGPEPKQETSPADPIKPRYEDTAIGIVRRVLANTSDVGHGAKKRVR